MGFFSQLSFSWMNKPVRKARSGSLTVSDLHFPEQFTTDQLYDAFENRWSEEMQKEKATGQKPSLLAALRSLYGTTYLLAGLCKLLWGGFVICGAFFFVRSLLLYVDPKTSKGTQFEDEWTGWLLTGMFFLDAYLLGLALQRMGYLCMISGIRVRTALGNAICRKAFAMAHIAPEDAADVVSFMASDLTKVYDGMQEFHYLWTCPFEALTILGLLASLTLQYAAPGIAVLCIVLPLQYIFGWMIAKHKYNNSKNTQARGAIIQEVLPAMKLIKYYCWERFIEGKISAIRERELKLQFKIAVIKVINISIVFAVPPITALVIFLAYEFSYKRLVAAVAFTTLSLFNILRFPLVVLPKALRAASEGYTSLKRIEAFLLQPVEQKQKISGAPGIRMDRAVFQYKNAHGNFKVRVPKFECRAGEVVAVVGRVGAGKSSLLNALLGNMDLLEGSYQLGGRIAYVPQVAWVQNMSIKDNILFGLPYDEAKYRQVIHDCALEMDLDILPLGDGTFGGLRGINLSGGQRQRVNLARAAYYEAQTVLLDNALSAVDQHTAEHIFDHLIKGTFADKAVVLITHQLNFLSRCDKVCIMDGGDVHYFGPWSPSAQSLLAKYLPVDNLTQTSGDDNASKKPKAAAKAAASTAPKKDALPVTKNTLYWGLHYWMLQAGWAIFPFTLFFFLSAQTSRQMSDYWIRQWVADTIGLYNKKLPKSQQHGGRASLIYTQVYMSLVMAFFILMLFRGSFYMWWVLRAANGFQRKMLRRVLNTPMSFLLVKPIGDLLINFTADQDTLDENLPDAVHYAGIYGLILLSTAITVSVAINMFAIFAPGTLVLVTGIMLWFYLPASSLLKKLRNETNSATVGLVAEVLEGLPVIQAFGHTEHFVHEAATRIDTHNRVLFNCESLNLWLAFFCDAYGAVLVLGVCCFAVTQKEELGSAVVGLAFSNTIQMLVFYTWSVRVITEALNLWASVEKNSWLANFTPVDGKDDVNNAGTDIKTKVTTKELLALYDTPAVTNAPANWPSTGEIRFENVQMRYRPTTHLALNGVSFVVQPSEKVGVVGRTGSGKSTLLLALYRMFELAGGRVVVDGVDIASLPLATLRKGLSIIPQEPVIFSGTVRENMDPYNEHSDAELWQALRDVGLDGEAKDAGGLEGHLDGSGSGGWSLGQMQLMCLARAALRKVPVLCCDEATAAMDPHTEALVIKTIARLFASRTVLTIAHRLDVVIGTDKVLVMEQGKVAEMDEPHALLSNRDSWFSKLVDKSGPEAAAALRAAAAEHARTVRRA